MGARAAASSWACCESHACQRARPPACISAARRRPKARRRATRARLRATAGLQRAGGKRTKRGSSRAGEVPDARVPPEFGRERAPGRLGTRGRPEVDFGAIGRLPCGRNAAASASRRLSCADEPAQAARRKSENLARQPPQRVRAGRISHRARGQPSIGEPFHTTAADTKLVTPSGKARDGRGKARER